MYYFAKGNMWTNCPHIPSCRKIAIPKPESLSTVCWASSSWASPTAPYARYRQSTRNQIGRQLDVSIHSLTAALSWISNNVCMSFHDHPFVKSQRAQSHEGMTKTLKNAHSEMSYLEHPEQYGDHRCNVGQI